MHAFWHTFFDFVFHEVVEVLLGNVGRLLRQTHVVEDWHQVEGPLANEVIGLEDIEIPCLNDEQVVFSWGLNVEEKSVIEGSGAIHAPVMSVSALLILVVNVSLDEDIACAFKVFTWNVLCVHD